jgi:hypothetical protein
MTFGVPSYKYLIEEFGEEKITSRYDMLCKLMQEFIVREGLEGKVIVSKTILYQVIIDYFADIHRLKSFHGIDKVNQDKITAYTLFWVLRRKPLQLLDDAEDSADFINERFVISFLQLSLFNEDYTILVSPEKKNDHENFFRSLLYSTKYRNIDAQMIELIIITYRAGRAFQYSVDVSQKDSRPCFLD